MHFMGNHHFSHKSGIVQKLSSIILSFAMILTLMPLSKVAKAEDDANRNLRNYINNVTLSDNGKKLDDETWQVIQRGNVYQMNLSFNEEEKKQFADTGSMTYTLPEGISIYEIPETMDIETNTSSGKITISGNKLALNTDASGNQVITLTLNENDPNFSSYQNSGNAEIFMGFKVVFSSNNSDGHGYDFGNGIIKKAVIQGSSGVEVSKAESQGFSSYDGKVHYRIKVKSLGAAENIYVKDTLTSDVLKIDADSIKIAGDAGGTAINSKTLNNGNKGFDLTLSKMKENQEVYIEYTATPDISSDKINTNGEVVFTSENKVVVTHDDKTDEDTYTINKMKVTSINKWNSVETETKDGKQQTKIDDDGNVIINWTVQVNPEKAISMKDIAVTDTLESGQTLVNNSFKVKKKYIGSDGKEYSEEVSNPNIKKDTEGKWTFTPSDDGKCSYEISYQTKKSAKDSSGNTIKGQITARNDVSYPYGSTNSVAYIELPKGENIVSKAVDPSWQNTSTEKIDWVITIKLKAGTSYNRLYLDDVFPNKDVQKSDGSWEHVYEGLYTASDSNTGFTVDGLKDGESLEKVTDGTNNTKVRLKFTHTENNTKKDGLVNNGEGAADRTITVKLSTQVNTDWLAWAEKNQQEYMFTHTNTVNLYKNDEIDTATADAKIKSSSISKTGERSDDVTIDGKTYPVARLALVHLTQVQLLPLQATR